MNNKILIITIMLMLAPSLAFAETNLSEVESNLMCTCGCSMALYSCECGTASKMRNKIQSMISQGKDKDQIVASFVDLYGEKILSAPTKTGFNLTAWVTPFLVIGIVGVFLLKSMKRWKGKRPVLDEIESQELHQEYGEKLKNELNDFNDGDAI